MELILSTPSEYQLLHLFTGKTEKALNATLVKLHIARMSLFCDVSRCGTSLCFRCTPVNRTNTHLLLLWQDSFLAMVHDVKKHGPEHRRGPVVQG